MGKKLQANITPFITNHRLALWVLLLVLPSTILVFPVSIHYVYAPIQSVSIFGENILLFGVIYCIWSLLLFSLLFTNAQNGEWQRLAIVCQLESDFENSHDPRALFIISAKFTRASGHLTEIKLDDPDWLSFMANLEKHNRIYVNARSEIYVY